MKCMLLNVLCFLSLSSASIAVAQCTAQTDTFIGDLIVVAKDLDGFPTKLGMPAEQEDLPFILLDCEAGTEVTISVSKPKRTPDQDAGPKLEGPLESYFYYRGESYNHEQSLTLTGGFEDLPVRVRMVLSDKNRILLASDDYRYTMTLVLTTVIDEPIGNGSLKRAETVLQLDSELLNQVLDQAR